MSNKLKVVIVDDDPFSVLILQDHCKGSPLAEIVASFNDPREFLKSAHTLEFDLCVLDIMMPQMEGTMVAQILKNKPVIFVTGVYDKLREALDLAPIDIVTKPVFKARLDKALGKAFTLLARKEDFRVFNVAAKEGRVKLALPDIMLVLTDVIDSRHKQVLMRNGKVHTLMDCSMDDLLLACPLLVQANKGTAVSMELVNEVELDCISLKGTRSNNIPMQIPLGRAYRKGFIEKLSYF